MDTETVASRQLRRSARQSSGNAKAVNVEPTPRGPLKRTKKSKPQPASAINGDKDAADGSDDEGSPNKKSRQGEILASGDDTPNYTQEPMETLEGNEEQKADVMKDSNKLSHRPVIHQGHGGDANLNPCVVLVQRCSPSHPESETLIKAKGVEPPKKYPDPPSKGTNQIRPTERTSDKHHVTVTSMADYKRKMEAKITEKSKRNHYVPINSPTSMTTTTIRQRTIVPSAQKTNIREKKQETKKTTVSPKSASEGFLRYLLQLVLLTLLGIGFFSAFKNLPTPQRTRDGSRSDFLGQFEDKLSRVEMNYPTQHPELWKMTKIHILKHLNLSHPTEPVSMILTAGVRAENTLRCLAQSLASAFSSSLNASVIHIDGTGKTDLDSDQVKMDIDEQLKTGFGGDKVAAVIHRFEELPPGSTLIFYRYCDHETAAYKRVFLLFTVLLSEEDLSTQHNLQEVEEMVRDHITERFVSSETAFNKMDADKFSGLWSRIAHLILPVTFEEKIDQRGC